jgi:hypothetical protein
MVVLTDYQIHDLGQRLARDAAIPNTDRRDPRESVSPHSKPSNVVPHLAAGHCLQLLGISSTFHLDPWSSVWIPIHPPLQVQAE